MKLTLSIVLVMFGLLARAQDAQVEIEADSVRELKSSVHFYIGPSIQFSQFSGTVASFAGVCAGVGIGRHLEIELGYCFILNNYQRQIVFPNSHRYDQKISTLRIQYALTERNLRPLMGISMQMTDASWQLSSDAMESYRDYILGFGGFVGVSWSINRYLDFVAHIGYSFPIDVELISFDENDYSGFNSLMAIKFNIGK